MQNAFTGCVGSYCQLLPHQMFCTSSVKLAELKPFVRLLHSLRCGDRLESSWPEVGQMWLVWITLRFSIKSVYCFSAANRHQWYISWSKSINHFAKCTEICTKGIFFLQEKEKSLGRGTAETPSFTTMLLMMGGGGVGGCFSEVKHHLSCLVFNSRLFYAHHTVSFEIL